ncbi:transposable element Tcb2 transposase [Trichonephila clavipes]|nr:transposable element Tcb2 transposase [Trichonephila clavipes]
MHNGKTQLRVFQRRRVTSLQYCIEIILDHIRIYRDSVCPDLLFMYDNTWPQSVKVYAYSSDLNPIEHTWDAFGRRVALETLPPRSVQELKTALTEEWNNTFPQGLFDSLVKSMENKFKMCTSVCV